MSVHVFGGRLSAAQLTTKAATAVIHPVTVHGGVVLHGSRMCRCVGERDLQMSVCGGDGVLFRFGHARAQMQSSRRCSRFCKKEDIQGAHT